MKNQMTLTILHPQDYRIEIGTITRSFDNAKASGNFAVCRVKVNGKRFSRVACVTELFPATPLPETHPCYFPGQGDLWRACVEVLYKAYKVRCNAECLDAHDRHMWAINGYPKGPIG